MHGAGKRWRRRSVIDENRAFFQRAGNGGDDRFHIRIVTETREDDFSIANRFFR